MNVTGKSGSRLQSFQWRLKARWTFSSRKAKPLRGVTGKGRADVEFKAESAARPTGGDFSVLASETVQAARFALLKQTQLLRQLDEIPRSELHVDIICAAEEAAVMAWQTPFPFLVFCGLFEERVRAACLRDQHQALNYWQALRPPVLQALPLPPKSAELTNAFSA